MEDPLIPLNAGLDTAEKSLTLAEHGLNFFERYGFIGLSEKRRQKLLSRQKFALQQEALSKSYNRLQEIEDTALACRENVLKEIGNAILEDVKKRLPELNSQEVGTLIQEVGFTLGSLTKNAFEEQKAREDIVMLALDNLETSTANKEDQSEPKASWMAQFMEYAGKIRDEDIAELWGKILAGEYTKPGSYSLKTLSILYSLDPEYAAMFKKLLPYVIDMEFIPEKALEKAAISIKDKSILESLGLIITSLSSSRVMITATNKYYLGLDPSQITNATNILEGKYNYTFSGVILTPAGMQIASILPPSKEEYRAGMELFAEVALEKFGRNIKIIDLEDLKKPDEVLLS